MLNEIDIFIFPDEVKRQRVNTRLSVFSLIIQYIKGYPLGDIGKSKLLTLMNPSTA